MELEYQRNLKNSYMILKTEADGNGYDIKVLKDQACKTLLPMQIFNKDGRVQYWYDVSGLQSLEVYVSVQPLDEDFFANFLLELGQTAEWIERHLLEETHLLLLPETIFLDTDTKSFLFCYCIFWEKELTKQFQGLMEELLKKIDHNKKETAQLAYELYDTSLKSGYQFKMLQAILEKYIRQENQVQQDMVLETIPESTDKREEIAVRQAAKPEECQSFIWKKTELFRQKIIQILEEAQVQIPFLKKQNREPVICFEPEEEQKGGSHPTVLLAKREAESVQGMLYYEGNGCQEDIKIDCVPFLIGSDAANVHGVIENDAVSRVHARITKEGDVYFLEDLNSTNGTFFEQEILRYREKVSLHLAGKVRFANENYCFR